MTSQAQSGANEKGGGETYGQILKSSFLVGGSQMIILALRLVRGKAMAAMLGPAGFGLFSVYGSIENMVEDIAGLGVSSSGVRQIADAAGSGDRERIARTAAVLQYTSIALGLLGALALAVFSRQISTMTFGSPQQAPEIALLSLAVIFSLLAYGQDALIEGLRHIADFSKAKVYGFFFSMLVSLPIVYCFRRQGVAPSLVVVAAVSLFFSWWFRRKIDIAHVPLNREQVREEVSGLLKLGVVLMLSSLMQSALAYVVRALLLHREGLDAAGLYQSAWTLGGIYVGFIIKAMAADFYPRLTSSAKDNLVCNRLVNEQVRIGLLLAGPGVMITLTFCPAIVTLLYTAKFVASVEVLRWICLGATLQVVTWPVGYIPVAKGRGKIFFVCELICAAIYAGLAWLCIERFGLKGAGIAFLGYCIVHGFIYYPIARRMSGFHWSRENLRTGAILLVLLTAVSAGFQLLPPWAGMAVGVIGTAISTTVSIRALTHLVAWEQIPAPVRRLLGIRRK